MSRPLRIEYPGALYHVMSRGNDRRNIVRDDMDRDRWVRWLSRTVQTYGWHLHAYVLMSNHYHVFVETPEANLSAGMGCFNGSYTGYFNKRHRRVGHLLQGRYKAHLIEEAGHYREVSRYIHLNPVRAKMVDRPVAWPWSSYPGYVRRDRQVDWVTYSRVLSEFGRDVVAARRAYRRFVLAGVKSPPPSPLAGAVHGLIIGSDRFREKLRDLIDQRPGDAQLPQCKGLRDRPPLTDLGDAVRRYFGTEPEKWSSGRRSDDLSRAMAAYLARQCYGYAATEVARWLGYRSHGSVAQALRRIESRGSRLEQDVRKIRVILNRSK